MPLLALFLAWLVPGAGHAYLGRVKRGLIIFVTLTATFWSGIAIGGVMTVDYHSERWWFIAEMCGGINGLISWQRQQNAHDRLEGGDRDLRKAGDPQPKADERLKDTLVMDERLAAEGIALVSPGDTVARAYAGIAGLLNLLCIFDAVMLALMGETGEPKRPPAASGPEGKA